MEGKTQSGGVWGVGHLKTASIARSQTGCDSWQTEAYLARNQAPAEDEAVEEAEEKEK